ncbi:hypothetical protein E0Z10_g3884 [Xylaria hypoxylon]|uniref:Uncharacterized protein n=1 Tax=Xylaria hypoxylon TaxID=37992 RepID=A0A4Z0YMC9_9PEZI|nr:hypothetical protein E0Z10_g3884 [Xylaria hypoxylon]
MIHPPGRPRVPFRRRNPLNNQHLDHPQPHPELKNTHKPTPKECAEVKGILGKAASFPPEIVDIVMDFAEYWTCSVSSIDYSVTSNGLFSIRGGSESENTFLLRTEPLGLTTWHPKDQDSWAAAAPTYKLVEEYPREELERFVEGPPSTLEHPFRKIVFDIVSRDQGWSHELDTHHTFRSSWTWFDAGIDRFDKGHTSEHTGTSETEASSSSEKVPTTGAIRPIWPPLKENLSEYDHTLHPTADHKIQCNRISEQDWQHHHIEWSCTDDIDPESSAGQELDAIGRGSATGDGSFLRNLKVGDMLTVWGRARFPGWMLSIQKVQVEVYWAL